MSMGFFTRWMVQHIEDSSARIQNIYWLYKRGNVPTTLCQVASIRIPSPTRQSANPRLAGRRFLYEYFTAIEDTDTNLRDGCRRSTFRQPSHYANCA